MMNRVSSLLSNKSIVGLASRYSSGIVRPTTCNYNIASSSIVSSSLSSSSSTTRLNVNTSISIPSRNLWVIGKDAQPKDFVDPNAPTTYKPRQIYCDSRVVVGKAGSKKLRYNGFVPATITGGGLPTQNIAIEWGRLYGLIKTDSFYRNRKFILNIDGKEQIVVVLAFAKLHALSERALFLKFVRTSDKAEGLTEQVLPFITFMDKINKVKEEKREAKKNFQELMKIDLTFKPAIKKTA
ncbi:hypothetical protein DFA_04791 [Cavenderia fasciculata]|uniref:Large ribosomal subunit protein bL25 L25 domain-containing protein n=1 Tax=Cavenderia fasciculata TaxID=261658 RepID=F4PNY2_CACFS|nr:uncharacterized protein DFA_04791 [Cavenderia fasciculata]EGG22661.1 hypothetical protein DFA_04791 [Cavenderia fasciculata]|eukprot:XP_004360512.1 hypothetical protein DFA_04791 [Cavenderia fasciculata]